MLSYDINHETHMAFKLHYFMSDCVYLFWVWFDRYCSNYYSEFAEPIELCDWCQSEEKTTKQGSSSKKSAASIDTGITSRSEYSGDKIKQQQDREAENAEKGKSPTPSPRTATRRYKLLKDVMCWSVERKKKLKKPKRETLSKSVGVHSSKMLIIYMLFQSVVLVLGIWTSFVCDFALWFSVSFFFFGKDGFQ